MSSMTSNRSSNCPKTGIQISSSRRAKVGMSRSISGIAPSILMVVWSMVRCLMFAHACRKDIRVRAWIMTMKNSTRTSCGQLPTALQNKPVLRSISQVRVRQVTIAALWVTRVRKYPKTCLGGPSAVECNSSGMRPRRRARGMLAESLS